jgi:signal transduction histidine kinase
VTVSSFARAEGADVEVTSGGEPFVRASTPDLAAPEGLGLPIVEWIARAHGGQLRLTRRGTLNVVTMGLAARAAG